MRGGGGDSAPRSPRTAPPHAMVDRSRPASRRPCIGTTLERALEQRWSSVGPAVAEISDQATTNCRRCTAFSTRAASTQAPYSPPPPSTLDAAAAAEVRTLSGLCRALFVRQSEPPPTPPPHPLPSHHIIHNSSSLGRQPIPNRRGGCGRGEAGGTRPPVPPPTHSPAHPPLPAHAPAVPTRAPGAAPACRGTTLLQH